MSKHKQFDSNYLTKHKFSRKYLSWITIPRNSKTLGFTVPDTQLILGSCFEPAFHSHYRLQIQPIQDSNHYPPCSYPHGHGAATGCSIWFQKNVLIRSHVLGPIQPPLMVSIDLNIRKTLKMGIKPKWGENPTLKSLKKLTKTGVHA